MGTTERKQRQKQVVYDSILKAGWKLVQEEGWQGLSIRKIAEAIEYSIPVIYDHFENKEAILSEFTKTGFRLLNRQLRGAIDGETDKTQRLRAVTFAYWDFAFKNQEYYQLMYGMGMPSCETINELPELRNFTETLTMLIADLYNGYQITDAEVHVKMRTYWSMLHGSVSIYMMGGNNLEPAKEDPVLLESVNNFIAGIEKMKAGSIS